MDAKVHDRTTALLSRYVLLLILIAMCVTFSLLLPDTFATLGNFRTIVNTQAIILMLAVIATVVLRLGDFDLSIAAMMTATCSLVAVMLVNGFNLYLTIAAALALGLVVGVLNGVLVVRLGVSAFVVTLGMLTALAGIAIALTDGAQVIGLPPELTRIARTDLLGLPMTTWIAWILAALIWYVYERTPLGRYMLFIGGGREAARLAGVNVASIRMGGFVVSALLSAGVGVLLAASLGAADPNIGGQYLLPPFAAAFLGATAIQVGRFNVLGTVIALYVLAVGITGLQLLGARGWVSDVFNGVALILAVTLARIAERRSA
jgi:ribose transport system permease protein